MSDPLLATIPKFLETPKIASLHFDRHSLAAPGKLAKRQRAFSNQAGAARRQSQKTFHFRILRQGCS